MTSSFCVLLLCLLSPAAVDATPTSPSSDVVKLTPTDRHTIDAPEVAHHPGGTAAVPLPWIPTLSELAKRTRIPEVNTKQQTASKAAGDSHRKQSIGGGNDAPSAGKFNSDDDSAAVGRRRPGPEVGVIGGRARQQPHSVRHRIGQLATTSDVIVEGGIGSGVDVGQRRRRRRTASAGGEAGTALQVVGWSKRPRYHRENDGATTRDWRTNMMRVWGKRGAAVGNYRTNIKKQHAAAGYYGRYTGNYVMHK